MAQETNKTAASNQPAKKEPTFTLATIRAGCVKTFGCTSSTFDGAFFDKEDKEYTISEAKKIIEEWLKKEVE